MCPVKLSKEFNQIILESVDDGLSILGDESVLSAFYSCLEKRKGIERQDIPYKVDAFLGFLEELFHEGASIIERRIERSLFKRIHTVYVEHKDWRFNEYVDYAHSSYVSNGGK